MMEGFYHFHGARKIATYCCPAERTIETSVGIHSQVNPMANFQLSPIGPSKLDGIHMILAFWPQLLSMAKLQYKRFRIPKLKLMALLGIKHKLLTMKISSIRRNHSHEARGLRYRKHQNGYRDRAAHHSVLVGKL